MSQMLSVTDTTANWATERKVELVFKNETGSTNDDAKQKALAEVEAVTLYLATHQTAGRGRGKNTWLDTGGGEALLCTWSFAVNSSPQAITGPLIGLALFKAARKVWPSLNWSIKAPNDLYLDGLKVGGLLVETVSGGGEFRLLVGLGVNILNHPRKITTAEHLSKTLRDAPEEAEWFHFMDELLSELKVATSSCLLPQLSEANCRDLVKALNANSAKAFTVQSISPNGDLIHAGGQVRWTDL